MTHLALALALVGLMLLSYNIDSEALGQPVVPNAFKN